MSNLIAAKIAFLLLLLLCAGFFSASEEALLWLSRIGRFRAREEEESPSARWIQDLVGDSRSLLLTILIGQILVTVSAAALTASLAADLVPRTWAAFLSDRALLMSVVVAALLTPALVFLGEVIPKTVAAWDPRRFARRVAVFLWIFHQLTGPVRWAVKRLADRAMRSEGGPPLPNGTPITEEEFRALVDLSRQGGALRESEREIIHNIFDFAETRVTDVMTSRTEVFALRADRTVEQAIHAIGESHHSRIPVYEEEKDDVIGILYSKDLLRLCLDPAAREKFDLRAILRKPYFVPEAKRASDLFQEFRFSRIHMAIVVDEYGDMAGVVTMEDLLECLFGEIHDEYDVNEALVRPLEEGVAIVSARMPVEEFNRQFGADLPESEYDTLGGLVFDLFGQLPKSGLKVSYGPYTFIVEKMKGPRILELRVQKEPESPGAFGEEPAGSDGARGQGESKA
ncbi:MAG: hemolysin family protein [bacterium]